MNRLIDITEGFMKIRDNVRWGLHFTECDLATLRPGDKLNMMSELHEFFTVPDSPQLVITAYGLPLPEPAPAEHWREIVRLQATVRDLLRGLGQTGHVPLAEIPDILLRELRIGTFFESPGAVALTCAAPWPDAFVFLLLLCLWQAGLENLLPCQECSKLFLRVRRQRYCGPPCANRAAVKAWRQIAEHKEKEKQRAAQRSDRHQQKTDRKK
jgi:hypothetical protein